MPLHVVEPGLLSLVVDFGRPRSRSLGVPVGGAADRTSLMLGNALVGNPPDAAALEITLAGPVLRADTELGCVVYGAPFTVVGDRHPHGLRAGTSFTLLPGEVLRIGSTPSGVRAYVCVRGGLRYPAVLDSHSSLHPIRAGEALECAAGTVPSRYFSLPPDDVPPDTLRAVPGPQADWFQAEAFYQQPFTVTPASNRMGLRLQGEPLVPREPGPLRELVSEPVSPGAVQVTRDGQCIVLGVDGQTIGGYPKVAHVIAGDLDRLGQLRPGQPLRFVAVTLAEAETLYRARQAKLREWLARLRASLPAGE